MNFRMSARLYTNTREEVAGGIYESRRVRDPAGAK
jgi:hypothetical protein